MKKHKSLAILLIACLAVAMTVFVAANRLRQQARMNRIVRALRDIGVAVQNHRDLGSGKWLPQAGQPNVPASSWRYWLLPFLEHVEPEFADIPWKDGRYRDYCHPAYCLTNHMTREGTYTTNCLAVTGPGTLAESDVSLFESDAILVIAGDDTNIAWGDPGDFEVDHSGRPIGDWPNPIFGKWIGVLFGDGRVWLLSAGTPRDKLELFFTVAGARSHDADAVLTPYRLYGTPFR